MAAAAGLAAAPIAGQAQQTMAQGDLLGLPSDLTMLQDSDPNRRVATSVVNGFVITETDVDQRVALLLAANQRPVSDEEMTRVRMQVLRNLIDETLQIQAAIAQELDISQAEVDQTYARVAAQNFGQEPGRMDEYLTSIGSSPEALKRQITGELAWNALLRRNIAPFVNVSSDEVNELIERLEASVPEEQAVAAESKEGFLAYGSYAQAVIKRKENIRLSLEEV
ncbi:MAG: SurA N-terminal domain-containing protein, partial [Pseudomonadota bacterium]|nr:SurA N-terminal domain-containing protein [Pseudomonadota bacterium]